METYNYLENVTNDVREYWEENKNDYRGVTREEVAEKLHNDLWAADGVTGNGSGSYTFSAWQAEENLCHNIDLLLEALTEFGCVNIDELQSAETCDVTIRCYLLPRAIEAVLDEAEESEDKDEYEDEDDEDLEPFWFEDEDEDEE